MSESKIDPPGAALPWLPGQSEAAPRAPSNTPDQSFNDDDVVARQAAQRAAEQRANQDRFVQKTPQSQVVKEQEEVVKASTFLPAGTQDAETQRLLQRRRYQQMASTLAAASAATTTSGVGETVAANARRARFIAGQPLEEMAALEQRLQAVLTYLEQLEQPSRQQAAHALLPDPSVQQAAVAAQQQRLISETKMLLLKLLTCQGFVWLQDWRLTFKRLFTRLRRWPRCLPPGHPPDSEADIDVFLSWVFAPPVLPAEVSR